MAACVAMVTGTISKWDKYEAMVKAMETNSMLDDVWEKEHFPKFKGGRTQALPEGSLNCPPFGPSPTKPTSVHKLRPTDVDLVAAIGDSLTAANGALAATPLGLLTEYRGRSFSMGGDKDASTVVTMPNILRAHVSDLHGHSSGTGKQGSSNAKLNFAVPGSTAKDLHGQALKLVDTMKNDPNVDFKNDWKVITVFIGGNDACNYFDGEKEQNSPDKYIEGVKKAIDVFHATVPRAFVNLVEVLDLSILPDLSKGLICPLLHRYLCKHIASGKDNAAVKLHIQEYNQKIFDLVSKGKYETRDDFTVVIQPFFRNTTYPRQKNGEPDWSFFAPDCFHSQPKVMHLLVRLCGITCWSQLVRKRLNGLLTTNMSNVQLQKDLTLPRTKTVMEESLHLQLFLDRSRLRLRAGFGWVVLLALLGFASLLVSWQLSSSAENREFWDQVWPIFLKVLKTITTRKSTSTSLYRSLTNSTTL